MSVKRTSSPNSAPGAGAARSVATNAAAAAAKERCAGASHDGDLSAGNGEAEMAAERGGHTTGGELRVEEAPADAFR